MAQENSENKTAERGRSPQAYLLSLILIVVIMLVDMIGRNFFEGMLVYVFDSICLVVMVIACIVIYNRISRRFEYRVNEQAVQIGNEYQQYMSQWQTPYLMLDNHLKIVWYNDSLRKIISIANAEGKTLEDIRLDWGKDKPDWDPIQKEITLDGRIYKALMTQIRLHEKDQPATESSFTQMYSLSLQDVTHERQLEQENFDQQTVVGLFYVDNYDQIISAMDEIQRPVLEAAIFRRLTDLSAELSGIMTRLERDRYLLQFPRRSLKKLCDEKKFDILEAVKRIDSTSRFQVTLSIGIGVDPDLATARRYARSGIELAMGRGGDQAVVKTKDDQKFYGGMTSSVESNTRVRARLIALALKERIEASDRVLIMGHSNPDLDCFGAALGVYRAVTDLKKPANIIMSADKHAAVDYLYRRVSEDQEHQRVLVDRDEAIRLCGKNTLLVIVDVNRRVIMQYGDILDYAGDMVVIDHHRLAADSVQGAAVSYVEPFASSASEMVTELLQYMVENPQLTSIEADGLFAGIALDTKNFTVKTGVRTFEAAAYLRRRGADSVRVRKMFKNDMEDYKAKAEIVGEAEIIYDNMAIATWSSQLPNATTVAAQAADELLDIHGVLASFVLTEMDHAQVNISARSLGEVNVQLIMEELGGGGHLTMAGAQLKDVTLDEAKDKVKEAIEEVVLKRRKGNTKMNSQGTETPV